MLKPEPDNSLDAPYPLKQRFYTIVLPVYVIIAIVIIIVLNQTSVFLIQKAYLKISESRSSVVDRALKNGAPHVWKELQSSTLPKKLYQTPKGKILLNTLRTEVRELGLSQLKIYGKDALILYSSDEKQIGTYDSSTGYENTVTGTNSLIEKVTSSGKLYELYVKVPNNPHGTIMELYEPVDYLNKLLINTVTPIVAFILLILSIIIVLTRKLVIHAQNDINNRTNIILAYKERLQQLVSRKAANTLRTNINNTPIKPKTEIVTILFSDIRGFTSYCDGKSPDKIVFFLNKLLDTEIKAIEKQNGDIDKIIGDAVLAFFQGKNSQISAFTAAKNILLNLSKENHPRGVGIGIYTGKVVIGTIGASNRKDFTIIGDAVNIASRFCTEAKKNEIIIDTEAYSIVSKEPRETELLLVKGKSKPINIHRVKVIAE